MITPTAKINLPIEDQLIGMISWRLNVAPTHIRPYTRFRDDLMLDSVDMTLLIAELESRFNLYLTHEEVDAIETVADAGRYFLAHAH
jgi:acyl carrier protein